MQSCQGNYYHCLNFEKYTQFLFATRFSFVTFLFDNLKLPKILF